MQSLQFCVQGNLRANTPSAGPSLHWGRWVCRVVEALRAFPWLWLSAWECSVQEMWGRAWHAGFSCRGGATGSLYGPSCLGKDTQVLPRTAAAFPQAFAVPLPGCCFLTLFNVLLHIMEGTAGTLERTLGFSRAGTVFVLQVKEHPQDRGGSWEALSLCFQGCFCFPVRTSSDWCIPSDCNAMPVNMH